MVAKVLDRPTLVLNRNWQPINVATVARALVLLWNEAARVVDPTDYQTYTKMLGWRVAPWLPLGLGVIACSLLGPVSHQAGLPGWFVLYLGGCATVIALPCLRFLWRPSAQTARLQPYAEAFLCAILAGIVGACVAAHGVPGLI